MTETKTDLQKEILDKFARERHYDNWERLETHWNPLCKFYDADELAELVALAISETRKDTIAKLEKNQKEYMKTCWSKTDNWCDGVEDGFELDIDWLKKEQGV